MGNPNEHPPTNPVPPSQNSTKPPGRKKWFWFIIILLLVAGASIGGLLIYKNFKSKSQTVNNIVPHADALYGRSAIITAEKGGVLTVYDAQKVGMTLTVPPAAVSKDTKLTAFPIKHEKGVPRGVMILTDEVKFSTPAELLFDFNFSKQKNPLNHKAAVYRYDRYSTARLPALIDRPLETKLYLPVKVLSAGTYFYDLSGKDQNTYARTALKLKKPTLLTVMESATILLNNKQKLSKAQKALVQNNINKILAQKQPKPSELYAAENIKRMLKKSSTTKRLIINDVFAGDLYAGYLLARCNDKNIDTDVLMSTWKTAQLLGYDDASANCEQRYKNIVAEYVNHLLDLDLSDVKYIELKAALREVQLLGLTSLEEPIFKKMRDKAVKEGTEVLRATDVDPYIITIALQNVQRYAPEEEGLQNQLLEKLKTALGKEISDVLGNQNATSDDIVSAIGKDKFNGGANEQALKEKLGRAVEREARTAKNDPNTTSERYAELGRRAEIAGNEDLAKEMYEKARNAPHEQKPNPDTSGNQEPPEETFAFDMNAIAVPLLQLFGLEDFSSEGVQKFKDQKLQEFTEMRVVLAGMCEAIRELGGDYGACLQQLSEYDQALVQFGVEADKAAATLANLEATPPEEPDDDYDGSSDNSFTGECISEEEAAEIDPNHTLYTVCPPDDEPGEDESDSQQEESNDNSQDDSSIEDNSSDSSGNEDNPSEDQSNSDESQPEQNQEQDQ